MTTPTAINEAYGEGFHWDRCGTLSEACERFFVQEACFYECSPHAGQYRRYSNGEAFAFYAWSQIDGNPGDPFYAYAADDPIYDGTFEHEGVTYNKSVFYGDGLYGPNQWQMYKMPIKASCARRGEARTLLWPLRIIRWPNCPGTCSLTC